jgi:predicted aspartyl protease
MGAVCRPAGRQRVCFGERATVAGRKRPTCVIAVAAALVAAVATLHADADQQDDGIPFEMAGRVLFVRGSLNGQDSMLFIVDTGATETVITPPAARRAGLSGAAAAARQQVGTARSISVGPATVRDLPVFIFDPPQALSLRLDHGMDYSGILGHSFLSRFVTTIDYRQRRIRFQPPGETAPAHPSGAQRVPFRVVDRQILAEGFINGKGPLRMLVDTGSAEMIVLPDVARRLGIRGEAFENQPGAMFAVAEKVAVGPAVSARVPLVIYTPAQEWGRRLDYDAIVGTTFLRNYRVRIDYGQRMLTLVPYEVARPGR